MSDLVQSSACPVPTIGSNDRIVLAHGEGGRLMRRLLEERVLLPLSNPVLNELGDSARLPVMPDEVAMTTDSFVVSPLFFPGGDIGSLAVFGTINDLAVAGAEPVWTGLPPGLLRSTSAPISSVFTWLRTLCGKTLATSATQT
jgi:hydrogenase expression/formation protein HypE